ncbi:heparinase II/III domain-containing protein [Paenibacillus tritici]|uniref:heparinase II/III domain-containing protein n=1 Tax=Paenibacillus tritici TaxID=1873425 RepID=UPI001FE687C3|nr:heparinase II/III family protein [Paenibacillus tritici]
MTGEWEYAKKTKLAILYILNDFCQGAEHWMMTNLRPEGSDSYGAVQGGRLLCAVAVSYSLIRTADIFSEEERKRFYAMAEFLLRYMLDLRDRTEWTPEEAQSGCSNWQTDMCAGVGYLMMALPDFPNRHIWLNNANTVLLAQLKLKVNHDGSWPESIRYHHAALERFAGYAKVLKKATGENWFETTPLGDMFRYAIEMQTPGYGYFGGRIGTPPFGDHALGDGEEFGYFPVFIPEIAERNPKLADRIRAVWTAAGTPAKRLWGESIVLENLMVSATSSASSSPCLLNSTADFPDAGIYIFRRHSGKQTSYFAIMSSPRPIAHGHLDQGSFILYAGSVPLVMDSGIEGYFDSSTSWHICSYSHACVQFAAKKNYVPASRIEPINLSAGTFSLERGWVDVPRTSQVLEVRFEEKWESIKIEIANPKGTGRHIRSVVHIEELDIYLIRDEIKEYDGKMLFSLPVAALHSHVDGSYIQAECSYGMVLDAVFLSGVDSIVIDRGRSTPFFPGEDSQVSYMHYIRAVADAANGFLTVLSPRHGEEPEIKVIWEPDGSVCLRTVHGAVRLEPAYYWRTDAARGLLTCMKPSLSEATTHEAG